MIHNNQFCSKEHHIHEECGVVPHVSEAAILQKCLNLGKKIVLAKGSSDIQQ